MLKFKQISIIRWKIFKFSLILVIFLQMDGDNNEI